MSASFPSGTKNTADESRKDMATQLIPTAPMENSALIEGRAIFMAAPRKGLIKDVIIINRRISFLELAPDSVILPHILIDSKYSQCLPISKGYVVL